MVNARIAAVRVQREYAPTLWFTDGFEGSVDLAPWIEGRTGAFAAA